MIENNRLSKKNIFHLDAFIGFEREIRTKDSLHDFFKVEDPKMSLGRLKFY